MDTTGALALPMNRRSIPAGPIDGTLFVHYPCFDGLVSAAVISDFLVSRKRWSIRDVRFVNYELLPRWMNEHLPQASVIVDFLYHPEATIWADHHGTTFVNEEARRSFTASKRLHYLLYDRSSPSCAELLWSHLGGASSDSDRYLEMVRWATIIDAAHYDSVDDAIFGWSSPALEINLSLSLDANADFGHQLLRAMQEMELRDVGALPEVQSRVSKIRSRLDEGLKIVSKSIRLVPGDIAVADVESSGTAIVNRYSTYRFFPTARYSVMLNSSTSSTRILAMRNPWKDFESVNLGTIFEKYGGGGHQRVAALVIRPGDDRDPRQILKSIVGEIQEQDRITNCAEGALV